MAYNLWVAGRELRRGEDMKKIGVHRDLYWR
jgi:hypothetical protein